jgi:uncharacterized protein YfdQ (DUF2303 family)
MDGERESEARALGELYERLYGAQVRTVEFEDGVVPAGAPVLIGPEGVKATSLKRLIDEFRTQPERVQGTATIGDADSFLAHVARFAAERSAIFASADRKVPALVAVYDYSGKGAPAFHQHRARYACPLSEEWQAWAAKDGQAMQQADFAAFLEDRIGDVIVPPIGELDEFAALMQATFATPQKLLELARGLAITAELRVKQAVNLSSGAGSLQFEEVHAGEGGQPLTVPNFFLIAIPVFRSGPAYRIPVRLRYRVSGGKIVWFYNGHRADKVFDHAFDEIVHRVAEGSKLPVYVGAPEV